jgi:sortase (surface protein transpeptidase)
MFKIILYGFLLYLLYKFIFELVIPVSKATSQVKNKMREMQEMQNAQQEQYRQQTAQAQAQQQPPQEKKKGGDYIEFEEVK